jgi:hypothetical protein
VQSLELVPDFLLGPASDLAPAQLAVGPEAERDSTDVPVLGRVEVDRVFAVPATARRTWHHTEIGRPNLCPEILLEPLRDFMDFLNSIQLKLESAP